MGLFDWLFGPEPSDHVRDDDVQPPPSRAGAGPDIDAGQTRAKTERNLRRVQSHYDPETDSFGEGKDRAN